MTLIIDKNGSRWIDTPQKKKRKPARAIRFAKIAVGDQIMKTTKNHDPYPRTTLYYVVTDLWFDPVLGQVDNTAGQMVGYSRVLENGDIQSYKIKTTRRGLASQRFQPSDIDYITLRNAMCESDNVIGINYLLSSE